MNLHKYIRSTVFILLATLVLLSLLSGTTGWCSSSSKVVVVASTSWTGAIAQAAGADEVRVLAPLELKHPPEYDYRPADIAKLQEAVVFVYGGYEPFVKKLAAAAGFPEENLLQVTTMNEPENLKQQARKLAEKLGTQSKEEKWEKEFDRITAGILKKAEAKKTSKTRVLVQQHQQAFVKWLGYDIVGVFSAGEMSPAKVKEFSDLKPDLVIDNYHNPQGKPIVEIAKCSYVELINFPSVKAPGLIELFQENANRLGLE